MNSEKLVFGLLDTSDRIDNDAVAARLRDFTISWSRYGYHGLIIEESNINRILDRALELGFEYCLVQGYGNVIGETWEPNHSQSMDFLSAVCDWIEHTEFFVAGHILDEEEKGYGLSEHCLLVDLRYYETFGRPPFGQPSNESVRLIQPEHRSDSNRNGSGPRSLRPSENLADELETIVPKVPGWNFVEVSLRHGITAYNFPEAISKSALDLRSMLPRQAESFAFCLEHGISNYELTEAGALLSDDQKRFLTAIERQVANVMRGVFLWNVESYTDIASPPPEFQAPLSALYCVASGFKPNMILHTHGFDENTKLVFFDYSPKALEIKKLLHQEWDGEDYPRFIKYIFKKFPAPDTFYHLWADTTPDSLDWGDVNQYWQNEIARWGGEHVIKNHWAAYRSLRPVYLRCNVLTEPQRLLEQMDRSPNAVIWWSNAFFTVYSNWLYSIAARKRVYDSWIGELAARNPDVFLYGADYDNISVNFIQAKSYLEVYSQFGGSYLKPYKLHEHEIRF